MNEFSKKIITLACILTTASTLPCLISGNNIKTESYASYPLPSSVAGVKSHVINLNGQWSLKFSPKSKWENVNVPGELAMQGYGVGHDQPVIYRKNITVPADFAGKKVILRFDGTYSYAKLKINGHEARTHRGGFTRWETDVTRFIKPGTTNTIDLELTDPIEEISYAAGYAHHPILGILRDVTMFAVPEDGLSNLTISTSLDKTYRNGTVTINFDTPGSQSGNRIDVRLTSPSGKPLPTIKMAATTGHNSIEIPVTDAELWDAEHPRLYHVDFDLMDKDGELTGTWGKSFGIREVKRSGNRLLVNGNPVKLRGACRHDIHPTQGRSVDAYTDSIDVRLMKDANMNFVRTSHYPPTERFAELCDKYGIYIECETAVCFVDTYRQKTYAPGASQDDSTHTAQYLSQIDEMLSTFKSHPSVLFWSIGNESVYGKNFQASMEAVRAGDPTRPVIFSYPGTVPTDNTEMYDITSYHYPPVSGNMNQMGKQTISFNSTDGRPAIYDEWAHPACYTYQTLQEDPNIREFWGKSIEKLWDGVWKNGGALGGAIWSYVDERFMLPEPKVGNDDWREYAHTAKPEDMKGKCVGYGDWGIVDVWRRKKPEFVLTKRAYSPVRLRGYENIKPFAGSPIRLTVENRFDHTDLSEITAIYSYQGQAGEAAVGKAAPGRNGLLTIPAHDWKDGEAIRLDFLTATGDTIDRYRLNIGGKMVEMPLEMAAKPLKVVSDGETIRIEGNGFTVPVDKNTGLIRNAQINGKTVITSGPYLHAYINYNHLTGAEVREIASHLNLDPDSWEMSDFEVKEPDSHGNVTIETEGEYDGGITAKYHITVTPTGKINIDYETDGLPDGYVRATGLSFKLPDTYERLAWQREGDLDLYPANSMSGNEGDVAIHNDYVPAYGARPEQAWADDTHDYYYWSDRGTDVDRPLRMSAKAMKENVYCYSLSQPGAKLSVIDPKATTACRLSATPTGTVLYTDNSWDYPEIAWGNYCKAISALPVAGSVTLQLNEK